METVETCEKTVETVETYEKTVETPGEVNEVPYIPYSYHYRFM